MENGNGSNGGLTFKALMGFVVVAFLSGTGTIVWRDHDEINSLGSELRSMRERIDRELVISAKDLASAKDDRDVLRKELTETRNTLLAVQLEQVRRGPFIPRRIQDGYR